MATYKRYVLRCKHTNDLSDSEQQSFVSDVKTRLDGTGIRGYFVIDESNDWLEWEGEKTTLQDKLNEHVSDSRVDSYTTVDEETISSVNYDAWYGHAVPDCGESIS